MALKLSITGAVNPVESVLWHPLGIHLWAVVAAKTRKTVEKRYMILATQDVVVKAEKTRK